MQTIECPRFDEEKYWLGTLCRRGHEWGTTGKSLRYVRKGRLSDCKTCALENSRRAKAGKPKSPPVSLKNKRATETNAILIANHERISSVLAVLFAQQNKEQFERLTLQINNLKEGLYYLKSICHRNHNWLGLGYSVRNMDRSECQCCARENKMANYYANHEHNKERTRKWRELHKDRLNTIRSQKYHSDSGFRLRQKERSHAHFLRHREKFLEQLRQYNISNPLAKKARNCRRKAKMRNAKLNSKFYSNYQLIQRFIEQEQKCAYCQKELAYESSNCTIDHVLAISRDGKDEMSNILLACGRCNRSKNNTDVSPWFKRQSFYSESRFCEMLALLK